MAPRTDSRDLTAYAALVCTALFWAGNAVVARGMADSIPPVALSFWRWFLALAFVLPFAWRHLHTVWPEVRRRPWAFLWMGLLSISIFNTLVYLSAYTTTATNITLFNAAAPFAIALMSYLVLGDRLRRNQTLGICIAMVGLLVIISHGSLATLLGIRLVPGDLLMLIATLCWGLYSVLLRKFEFNAHPVALLAVFIMFGVPFIGLFYAIELSLGYRIEPGPLVVPAVLFVAIFPSLLAVLSWNHGLRRLGPNRTAMFTFLIPVFGATMAVTLLGERLGWHHAAGAGLILAGLTLSTRLPPPGAPAPAPAADARR